MLCPTVPAVPELASVVICCALPCFTALFLCLFPHASSPSSNASHPTHELTRTCVVQEEEEESTHPLVMWKPPIARQYWIDKTDASGQVVMIKNIYGAEVPGKVRIITASPLLLGQPPVHVILVATAAAAAAAAITALPRSCWRSSP